MSEIELKPTPNKSGNIDKLGYDEEKQELQVQFSGGGLYAYDSVPEFVYSDLLDAPSHGKYFHAKIKDQFPTRKLK